MRNRRHRPSRHRNALSCANRYSSVGSAYPLLRCRDTMYRPFHSARGRAVRRTGGVSRQSSVSGVGCESHEILNRGRRTESAGSEGKSWIDRYGVTRRRLFKIIITHHTLSTGFLSDSRPLQVQGKQAFQYLRVRQVIGPAVGVHHRLVQLLVGHLQPGGAGIVEVGKRPFL